MQLIEKGIGPIQLSQTNFRASGGEGDIFVQGNRAYKVYQDKTKVIKEAKINELAALSLPNIIKPERILLDKNNAPVGYSMNLVPDSYALSQLFPKAFKIRNSLNNSQICKLVLTLRSGIEHVHSKNILIVDVNELNFLVDKQFKDVYFIDVDSYKTRSFNPTAIMDSVRDRHSKDFSVLTDWFSFGVLAFNLLVGIHPFRGTYAPLSHIKGIEQNLDARMMQNISVLHKDVKVPPVVDSFDNIPSAYRDWFYAIFEEGKRIPPPVDLVQSVIAAAVPIIRAGGKLSVEPYLTFDKPISWKYDNFIFAGGLFYKNKLKKDYDINVCVGFTPKYNKPIAASIDNGLVKFKDIDTDRDINCNIQADSIIAYDNRFYVKVYDKVLELLLFETPQNLIISSKVLCTVMPYSTKLYHGCIIQNVVGKAYVSLLDKSGENRQIQIKELDGLPILSAKYEKNILVVAVVDKNQQKQLIFQFAENNKYSIREIITDNMINFIVLDNGICLLQNDEKLEIFSNTSTSIKIVEDNFLQQTYMLSQEGTQALAIVGNEVFKISLKK
jgi:serine/threonine protein kinase